MAVQRQPKCHHSFLRLSPEAIIYARTHDLLNVDCGYTVMCHAHHKSTAALVRGVEPAVRSSSPPLSPLLDSAPPLPVQLPILSIPALSTERQELWANLVAVSSVSSPAIVLHPSASCLTPPASNLPAQVQRLMHFHCRCLSPHRTALLLGIVRRADARDCSLDDYGRRDSVEARGLSKRYGGIGTNGARC